MIFQTEGAIDKIIAGSKTQTRRLVLPGEGCNTSMIFGEAPTINAVVRPSNKHVFAMKYKVGHDYAVQPGRGKPGVWWGYAEPPNSRPIWHTGETSLSINGYKPLRIRITAIRREDVRNITYPDAQAEGYDSQWEFIDAWIQMHDRKAAKDWNGYYYWQAVDPGRHHPDEGQPSIDQYMQICVKGNPADHYDAWCISFEVVKHNFESTSAVLRERAD